MALPLRMIVASIAMVVNGCAVVVDRIPPDIARHPSLARLHAARFPIGAAVEPSQLEGRTAQLLAWHFSSVTAENVMKPANLQPAEGRFDIAASDAIVDFAVRNGMKVLGHTLLWPVISPTGSRRPFEFPISCQRPGDGPAYRPATRTSDNAGALGVRFTSATTATMTLPDGRPINLVRQAF